MNEYVEPNNKSLNEQKGPEKDMARKTHGGEEIDRSVYSTNYTEFTLKKKADGKIILVRLLMICIYVGIPAGIFMIPNMWWLGSISFLAVAIACYFTWPFTNIEYEYTLSSGDFKFVKNYGQRKHVTVLEKKIKDMKIIAPYTEENKQKFTKFAKTYDFRKSPKHTEDIYMAVFEENGADNLILFQCTNKALKIFQSYNKQNTIAVDTLHY